ncbi:MAG: hypothetical protein GY749_06945 [Desulfobacteraceae bacterium]|nr:hypothetical protein [Desulfobacteraceae bacterium]
MTFYPGEIISFPNLTLTMARHNGLIASNLGDLVLIPTAMGGDEPEKMTVGLRYGLNDKIAIDVFEGTVLWDGYTAQALKYKIYKPSLNYHCLDRGKDENGKEVPIPLAIGNISFMTPQRTGSSSENRYYTPGFETGTFRAYDGGWEIPGWTDNGDGTVSRAADIVDTLYFSGTGRLRTLEDVAAWGAGRLGLEFDNHHPSAGTIPVDYVLSKQEYVLDFLGPLAFYYNSRIVVRDGVLSLFDAGTNNGISTLGAFGYKSFSIGKPNRIKFLNASVSWREIRYKDDTPIVEEKTETASAEGLFPESGKEENISQVYNCDLGTVEARLAILAEYLERRKVSITLPIYRRTQVLEEINLINISSVKTKTVSFRAENIAIDVRNKTITVSGTAHKYVNVVN